MPTPRPLHRVMLCQPNFGWNGKRTWRLLPYGLGLLNARLKQEGYDSWIYDPNVLDHTEEQVRAELRRTQPDVVGISSFSTEYTAEPRMLSRIVREELPEAVIVQGGSLPTVAIEQALTDESIDYHILGEGEYRLPRLLDALSRGDWAALTQLDGLAWAAPEPVIQPPDGFIDDLDALPFPDYGGMDVELYTRHAHRFHHNVMPRQFPYATLISSRGCPYRCVFCAAASVSGRKVRARSAENVLAEIDELLALGVRELIFLDDHFLTDRERALRIMRGIHDRDPSLTWKCVNVSVWSLDPELLRAMRETGCYQLTVSIESGNQEVLKKLVKKPVTLDRLPPLLDAAKALDFELVSNFVIGFPGETWDQIRQTFAYAAEIDLDLVVFHIATPLPQTELMETAVRGGWLLGEDGRAGFTGGLIQTDEFSVNDLRILRAYEWDRINFTTPEKIARIARMEGVTVEEIDQWRRRTRKGLGTIQAGDELTRQVSAVAAGPAS